MCEQSVLNPALYIDLLSSKKCIGLSRSKVAKFPTSGSMFSKTLLLFCFPSSFTSSGISPVYVYNIIPTACRCIPYGNCPETKSILPHSLRWCKHNIHTSSRLHRNSKILSPLNNSIVDGYP